MHKYDVELTDTFGGEANYCWVKRATISMPDMTHYGYDGSTNYCTVKPIYERELMRRAKAAVGLTGVRGIKTDYGDTIDFRPHRAAMVMFVSWHDDADD